MARHSNILDRLKIKSPCSADWGSMIGNDRVRFCEHCSKHVHNISAMTREEALKLVARSKGRLCVRYYHKGDERVVFDQKPIQPLYQLGKRASQLAAGVFSIALSVSGVTAQTPTNSTHVAAVSNPKVIQPEPTQTTSQNGNATVKGTITDATGAVIPGVEVKVKNLYSSEELTTQTDEEGNYLFQNLDGGYYTLEFQANGFSKEQKHVSVHQGEVAQVNGEMQMPMMGVLVIYSPAQEMVEHQKERRELDHPEDESIRDFFDDVRGEDLEAPQEKLRNGTSVNARNEYGDTALMFGANDKKMVRMLLAYGADVNAQNEFGVTALMYAALNEKPTVAKYLLRNGAEVDSQDIGGRTALMFAAMDGHTEVVKTLLAAKAKVNLRDKDGQTALDYAKLYQHTMVVELLKTAGAR